SQVMLEMAKLAPILKEIAKDIRVGSHDGCRSYDGKLHKTFALSPKGGVGPKSITVTPEMAKHNSRVRVPPIDMTTARIYIGTIEPRGKSGELDNPTPDT